ncbi:phosphoribosylglycinamide formyltransferase [Oceanibium sediminis]|uniref:phosphoribosylglycinamide formyltransferase n=1 Tax=Oceanibium sediminis TaxID=2026339 RepID=UPI000DD3E11F|nr:phosphoribosylglycinamide formyltransferase [Oceanibium sediminis]
MSRTRVAILISGSGSNMVTLAKDMASPDHPGEVALVAANKDAPGLAKAEAMGLKTTLIPHKGRPKAEFEAALDEALRYAGAEVICLAGFMRVLSPEFVARWEGRILNIHPSLLPLFKGLDTHARALDSGMAVHGCTVHGVTAALDDGPIYGQAVVPVHPGDTPDTLAERLLPREHELYPAVLRRFLAGNTAPLPLL